MFFYVFVLAICFRPEDFFGFENRYGDRYKVNKQHPGLPASLWKESTMPVYKIECPVCHSVVVLSEMKTAEIVVDEKLVFICSQPCIDLLNKTRPYELD